MIILQILGILVGFVVLIAFYGMFMSALTNDQSRSADAHASWLEMRGLDPLSLEMERERRAGRRPPAVYGKPEPRYPQAPRSPKK